MPLPLIVSWFSKIEIGFTFLVPVHPGSHGKGPLNGCVCVTSVYSFSFIITQNSYMKGHMVVLGTALGTLMVPGYWSLQMG